MLWPSAYLFLEDTPFIDVTRVPSDEEFNSISLEYDVRSGHSTHAIDGLQSGGKPWQCCGSVKKIEKFL
jgi:hypothetical protein